MRSALLNKEFPLKRGRSSTNDIRCYSFLAGHIFPELKRSTDAVLSSNMLLPVIFLFFMRVERSKGLGASPTRGEGWVK